MLPSIYKSLSTLLYFAPNFLIISKVTEDNNIMRFNKTLY
jgi:hypothetical protein